MASSRTSAWPIRTPICPLPYRPSGRCRRQRCVRLAALGWGGVVSLMLHGILLLVPAHFFTPPPVREPAAETFMMIAAPPNPTPPAVIRPLKHSPLPPLAPLPEPTAGPPPEPFPPLAQAMPEPLTPMTAPPVLRPKTKPKPVVVPAPVVPPAASPPRLPPPDDTSTAPAAVFPAAAAPTPPVAPPVSTAAAVDRTARAAAGPVEVAFGTAEGPRFKHRVRTRYPRLAVRLGQEGTVVLRLTIDAAGRLDEIEVIETSVRMLTDAAIRAVRASTYFPAIRDGLPVASRAVLPVRFKLKE